MRVFIIFLIGVVLGIGFLPVFAVDGQATAANETASPELTEFICHRNFFRVNVPSDWVQYEEIMMADETKEYGVDLKGPANKDGAFTSMTLIYYGPDHKRFTAEKFLKLNAYEDAGLKIEGEKYGKITDVVVAGQPANQFDKTEFLFLPIYAVEQVKIPMVKRTIVLKGKKGGFYVLEYSSPKDSFAQYLKIFEDVLASFRPNA